MTIHKVHLQDKTIELSSSKIISIFGLEENEDLSDRYFFIDMPYQACLHFYSQTINFQHVNNIEKNKLYVDDSHVKISASGTIFNVGKWIVEDFSFFKHMKERWVEDEILVIDCLPESFLVFLCTYFPYIDETILYDYKKLCNWLNEFPLTEIIDYIQYYDCTKDLSKNKPICYKVRPSVKGEAGSNMRFDGRLAQYAKHQELVFMIDIPMKTQRVIFAEDDAFDSKYMMGDNSTYLHRLDLGKAVDNMSNFYLKFSWVYHSTTYDKLFIFKILNEVYFSPKFGENIPGISGLTLFYYNLLTYPNRDWIDVLIKCGLVHLPPQFKSGINMTSHFNILANIIINYKKDLEIGAILCLDEKFLPQEKRTAKIVKDFPCPLQGKLGDKCNDLDVCYFRCETVPTKNNKAIFKLSPRDNPQQIILAFRKNKESLELSKSIVRIEMKLQNGHKTYFDIKKTLYENKYMMNLPLNDEPLYVLDIARESIKFISHEKGFDFKSNNSPNYEGNKSLLFNGGDHIRDYDIVFSIDCDQSGYVDMMKISYVNFDPFLIQH